MSKESKAVVDALIQALYERPDTFECGSETLTDKQNGYQYWVANFAHDTGIWQPFKFDFGWTQGRRLQKALRLWKAKQCVKELEKPRQERGITCRGLTQPEEGISV